MSFRTWKSNSKYSQKLSCNKNKINISSAIHQLYIVAIGQPKLSLLSINRRFVLFYWFDLEFLYFHTYYYLNHFESTLHFHQNHRLGNFNRSADWQIVHRVSCSKYMHFSSLTFYFVTLRFAPNTHTKKSNGTRNVESCRSIFFCF